MRTLSFIVIFLSALAIKAEDIIQVVPFQAQAGATSADGYSFSINMNNSSAEIWAFQFDILLPDGMTFDDTDGLNPFELGDRCPHTIGRGGVKDFKHIINYKMQDDGWWRIAVITTGADRIEDDCGEVLRAYYLTEDNFEAGIHPILVRSTVLTVSGNSDIKPNDSSSYCYVGASPLVSSYFVDLSCLKGYLPSWVVSSAAAALESNTVLTELDITGATAMGADLYLPNSNALCYIAEGSECEKNILNSNIVLSGEVYRCKKLSLHDEGINFYSSRNIECKEASYNRVYKAGVWSTVCLPFAVSEEKVSELFASGVEIEKLATYDNIQGKLNFSTVESMQPNHPYIIKCPTDMKPFESVCINGFIPSIMNNIICNSIEMCCVFSKRILDSDNSVSYYIFDSIDGSFVKVGKNATIYPFRSYISINNNLEPIGRFSISHDEANGETSIHNTVSPITDGEIYNINGVRIGSLYDNPEILSSLKQGVYLINNKKFIYRK